MTEKSEVNNRMLGDLVGVHPAHISRVKRQLLRDMSFELTDMDVREVAMGMKVKATELQQRAMLDHDFGLVWKIECELIEHLQRLGFVYREPERHIIEGQMTTAVLDLGELMKEFFKTYGIPSMSQFVQRLRELAKGNGGLPRPDDEARIPSLPPSRSS